MVRQNDTHFQNSRPSSMVVCGLGCIRYVYDSHKTKAEAAQLSPQSSGRLADQPGSNLV